MHKLISLALTIAACAPQPQFPSTPTQYACGDTAFIRHGSEVKMSGSDEVFALERSDSTGDHFITGQPGDPIVMELVVPSDPRLDARARTYDATAGAPAGSSRALTERTCTAAGGYNDVLARYIKGESMDSLTKQLAFESNEETRAVIHRAMVSLQRRYFRDR